MTAIALILVAAAVGCGSSLLPGPCNLAIVDGAVRGVPRRRQLATAAGGALGDLVYATLGAAGGGALLARSATALQIIAGLVFVILGTHRLLASSQPQVDRRGGGLVVGASLVLANPGVLITWSVVVAALAGAHAPALRLAVVLAIAAGSFGGFVLIGRLPVSRLPGLRTAIGAMLVVLGVTSLARAAGVG